MKVPFLGGCVCGAIRYECSAEPIEMFQCHCRDCQRASGGPFSCVVVVPAQSFKLPRGSLRYHFTLHAAGVDRDQAARLLALAGENLAFVLSAALEYREEKMPEEYRQLSESMHRVWMTQVGFVRDSTFSPWACNRGTM